MTNKNVKRKDVSKPKVLNNQSTSVSETPEKDIDILNIQNDLSESTVSQVNKEIPNGKSKKSSKQSCI